MSNNDLYCSKCESYHHPTCCPLDPEYSKAIEEQKNIEQQEYLEELQWQENMNHLYEYRDDGLCDGFTKS